MIFAFPYTKTNPAKDFEAISPPDDKINALKFSPTTSHTPKTFLIAGSGDRTLRCWEVEEGNRTVPRVMKIFTGPVTDVAWTEDALQVFIATGDNMAHLWDLGSDQIINVAQHNGPVTTCHVINAHNYRCLMTGSLDRTLKFWDTRSPVPMGTIILPERCCCAAVDYPMAAVATADGAVIIYDLENGPNECKRHRTPLNYDHRSIAIFRDKESVPTGYALSNVEGVVAIQHVNASHEHKNFTFMCNRGDSPSASGDFFPVNDLAFHPVHGSLATAGSDGIYNFWDIDERMGIKYSNKLDQAILKCAICDQGQLFAYAIGNDGLKPYSFADLGKKPRIFLRRCFEDMR